MNINACKEVERFSLKCKEVIIMNIIFVLMFMMEKFKIDGLEINFFMHVQN